MINHLLASVTKSFFLHRIDVCMCTIILTTAPPPVFPVEHWVIKVEHNRDPPPHLFGETIGLP